MLQVQVSEFELTDIFEECSIRTMDSVLAENVKYALREQLNVRGEVVILPTCQNAVRDGDTYTVSAPFEVFDEDDYNRIIGRGTVVGRFTVLDEGVFDDYGLEELELLSIDGSIELVR